MLARLVFPTTTRVQHAFLSGLRISGKPKTKCGAVHFFHDGFPISHAILNSATRHRQSFLLRGLATSVSSHPLDPLSAEEITDASSVVSSYLGLTPDNKVKNIRFVAVSLKEPPKKEYLSRIHVPRHAEIVAINPTTGIVTEYEVNLETSKVTSTCELPKGKQPMLTPEDCELAEAIVLSSREVASVLAMRYGITDMSRVACDPWSIHLASDAERDLIRSSEKDGVPARLVQTFLYHRVYGNGLQDNHYAHPIDIVPVVDLHSREVVTINGLERAPPQIPTTSVQYHRDLLSTNSYLQTEWRDNTLAALDVSTRRIRVFLSESKSISILRLELLPNPDRWYNLTDRASL